MKINFFVFFIFILFLTLSIFGQEQLTSTVFINLYDKNKLPVENVYLLLSYQEFVNETLVSRNIEGISDQNGQWVAKLDFDFNSTPSNYLSLYYYHPQISGKKVLSFNPYSKSSFYDVDLPIELLVHKIGVFQSNKPVNNAHFWFFRPYLYYSKTDKNGYITVRFPKNSKVEGFLEYQNSTTYFDFFPNESLVAKINYPFTFSVPIKFNTSFFNITKIHIGTSDKKPYAYKPVIISFNETKTNSTYFTDSFGMIYLTFSPFENLNIYYLYADQILSNQINLSNSSQNFRLTIPQLLSISKPNITYIGESCYNVKVEISEPRKGIVQKVYAKAIESNDTYLLTIE
ncbi:MAG: hypothetical protein ACK4J0_03250, partial [Candidatus Anstonellaceae archaeon]